MPPTIDRLLLQAVDAGLAGVVFVVPLFLGGRHPLGQLVLADLAVAMGLAWAGYLWRCDDPRWRPIRAAPLLLLGAALVLLQCVPLSPEVLQRLAPCHAHVLPLWNASETGLGLWSCLSITPAETRAALAVFLAYGLVFTVSVQRMQRVEDVERVLRWCALAAIGMACFGLVQFLGGNGKYFWFYELFQCDTSESLTGSFTNRNHFAHFLAMGVGPLIWWIQDALRRRGGAAGHFATDGPATQHTRHPAADPLRQGTGEWTLYLLGLSLGIVLFAGLLSLSRGGIAAMALAACVTTAVGYRAASLGNRFLGVLAAAALLIGVSLAMFGYDRVADRLDSLASGSLERLDRGAGRRAIWAATLESLPDRLWFGAGAGSFAEVYPTYADPGIRQEIEFTHGESGYLQVALEYGVVGLALVLGGIALCGWWCWHGLARAAPVRIRLCAGAIAASLAVSVAHAAVDFVWYVPACMGVVALLAAAALRVRQLADPDRSAGASVEMPRFAPATAFALLLGVGGWMAVTLVGPAMAASGWNRYRIAVEALKVESLAAENDGATTAPDGYPLRPEDEQKLIAELQQVVAWQPEHAKAQLALAESYLRQFERRQTTAVNRMSLMNIRDAALRSEFGSRDALTQWLSRAVGDHWRCLEKALWHAHRAIAACPLQGRAYVYLSELCFLDRVGTPSAYIAQALRVRPYDARVLWAAACDAYLAGQPETWLAYAKQAFHGGSRQQQRRMMADLIGRTADADVPVMIDFIVRQFEPDFCGVRMLYAECVDRCPADRLAPLTRYYAALAQREAERRDDPGAAGTWLDAYRLYRKLGETSKALLCLRNAVRCDPNDYDAHYRLADRLLEAKSFDEAESHLKWCQCRRPGDPSLDAKLRAALQGRLDAQLRLGAEDRRVH